MVILEKTIAWGCIGHEHAGMEHGVTLDRIKWSRSRSMESHRLYLALRTITIAWSMVHGALGTSTLVWNMESHRMQNIWR